MCNGLHHQYPTRAAGARAVAPARLEEANTSWRWRASAQYAALPAELRAEETMANFRARLKEHTRRHIDI